MVHGPPHRVGVTEGWWVVGVVSILMVAGVGGVPVVAAVESIVHLPSRRQPGGSSKSPRSLPLKVSPPELVLVVESFCGEV